MDNDRSISRAEIHQIAWRVRDDEANPEEVRELLEYICTLVDREELLPPEILKYIRDSFRAYLDDSKKSLDRSFGVTRKRGRPKADWGERVAIATEILRQRLKGSSHEDSVTAVGEIINKESSVIGESWAVHKLNALIALRNERPTQPWTEQEIQTLAEIFSKESWFIPPGKNRNKP